MLPQAGTLVESVTLVLVPAATVVSTAGHTYFLAGANGSLSWGVNSSSTCPPPAEYEYQIVASSASGVDTVVVQGFKSPSVGAVVPALLAHDALGHGASVWAQVRTWSSGGSHSPWAQSGNRSSTTVR